MYSLGMIKTRVAHAQSWRYYGDSWILSMLKYPPIRARAGEAVRTSVTATHCRVVVAREGDECARRTAFEA
jgi:hypothetical protein